MASSYNVSLPIIVIVPGAFHRPSHYGPIISLLEAEGFQVLCKDLVTCGGSAGVIDPNTDHLDDAREIFSDLQPLLDTGREAIVVSHSYGSLPSTELVAGQSIVERSARGLRGGVKAAINIAGFAFPVVHKNFQGGDDITPPMPYHIVKVRCSLVD
jgi:alpha-beta hydrolase superfamily lysophospholipase